MNANYSTNSIPFWTQVWLEAEAEVLEHAREVSRQITDRVRKVTEDTQVCSALPADQTEQHEALPPTTGGV